jgi:hypothetical protein
LKGINIFGHRKGFATIAADSQASLALGRSPGNRLSAIAIPGSPLRRRQTHCTRQQQDSPLCAKSGHKPNTA